MPKKRISEGELLLGIHLKELGLAFEKQFHFHPERRWTADFLLVDHRILIECEGATGYFRNPKGGITLGGRHSKEKGLEADCLKYNAAQMLGYRVLRFSSKQIGRGIARTFLKYHLTNTQQ